MATAKAAATTTTYPPWNDPPTTKAFADNVPSFPPSQPWMPNAGTTPGTMKVLVSVWDICEQSDVTQYLIPSLTGSGFQVAQMNEQPACGYYPVTWSGTAIDGETFTETRRSWFVPIPNLPPPPGMDYAMNVCCKMLLSMMMAKGVGCPGFWSYSVNAQASAGLVWNFV